MRKVLLLVLCVLIATGYSFTLREMRFENAKLETVLKAMAQAAELNVIFDPAIGPDLQKTVSISINKPNPNSLGF